MAERPSGGQGDQLRPLLGLATATLVEHAAMSRAVEDVVHTMDLCAAIINHSHESGAAEARRRGWEVADLRRGHLRMLVDPATTARLIVELAL